MLLLPCLAKKLTVMITACTDIHCFDSAPATSAPTASGVDNIPHLTAEIAADNIIAFTKYFTHCHFASKRCVLDTDGLQ
jgi:hypothetical protein